MTRDELGIYFYTEDKPCFDECIAPNQWLESEIIEFRNNSDNRMRVKIIVPREIRDFFVFVDSGMKTHIAVGEKNDESTFVIQPIGKQGGEINEFFLEPGEVKVVSTVIKPTKKLLKFEGNIVIQYNESEIKIPTYMEITDRKNPLNK